MPTLDQDFDNLDRMVDGGAAKDEIRSQIRVITRAVASLEAEHASLAEAHTKLQKTAADAKAKCEQTTAAIRQENAALKKENAALIAGQSVSKSEALSEGETAVVRFLAFGDNQSATVDDMGRLGLSDPALRHFLNTLRKRGYLDGGGDIASTADVYTLTEKGLAYAVEKDLVPIEDEPWTEGGE